MSLYRLRPLGRREELIAFELVRAAVPGAGPIDERPRFTLWDPQGRPLQAFPEIVLERATTGRALLVAQEAAWESYAARCNRLYGSRPLAGELPGDRPLRGILAFECALFSDRGRWRMVHASGATWHFTPRQLFDGMARPIPPAGRIEASE